MSTNLSRFSHLMALAVPAAGILTSGQALAASDIYMKIDGIEGESISSGFEKQMEVLSWSWGASQALAATGGGTGKATFKEFTVTKRLSSASPPLMLACAKGKHFPSAVLTLARSSPTGAQEGYYIITLSDVVVSSFSSSRPEPAAGATAAAASPYEKISLIFVKMHMEYRAAPVNGQAGAVVTASIDVEP